MRGHALLGILVCTLFHSSTTLLTRLPPPVLRLKNQVALRTGVRDLAQFILARGTHVLSSVTTNCVAHTTDAADCELNPRPNIHTPTCSCADVFALERRIDRLEHALEELMRELTTCDDMLLLEREGVKCLIADEGLVKTRPVKLLRVQLLSIMKRHKF